MLDGCGVKRRESMLEIRTQFYVQGMKDEQCAVTANETLATLPGFVSAEFDCAAGVAVVKGNIDPQAVCFLLAEVGYLAVVKSI
jgi:copper chaperone CopZ